MKLFVVFLSFLCIQITSLAQSFNMDTTINNTTITTCDAYLFDSGGSGGNYGNSELYTITFFADTGGCFQIDFINQFEIESGFDILYIYDGDSINDPLLGFYYGNTLPNTIFSSGQYITIRFISDGSVTQSGFEMHITCTQNCYVPPPPPVNLVPCTSTYLNVDTACNYYTYSNFGATSSSVPVPTCSFFYLGADVWFKTIVPVSGRLVVDLGQGTINDAGMAIYSGTDCNNITEILCDEQPWAMPFSLYLQSFLGLAGDTIWIRVWEQNNDFPGTFNICVYEPDQMLEVDTNYIPDQLVDVLNAGCSTVSNVQFDGDPRSIGYFSQGNLIGLDSGIVISNGTATDISGNDTYMDVLNYYTSQSNIVDDLLVVANDNPQSLNISSINDVAILEFDIIPCSDTIMLSFVFGSEEYEGFECTSFNDAFAFFISGPGIFGPYSDSAENIALVPGTNYPITVSTINNQPSCIPNNNQFYIQNTYPLNFLNIKGYTTPLTVLKTGLIPFEIYHIRLCIGDASDQNLNTYIFLSAGTLLTTYTVNLDEIESNNKIYIFPNPTTGKIRVEAEGMESIEVFDIYGKNLKGFENLEGLTEIDLSSQPKGIYIIKVTTSKGVAVEKVVLE